MRLREQNDKNYDFLASKPRFFEKKKRKSKKKGMPIWSGKKLFYYQINRLGEFSYHQFFGTVNSNF
jgi:hypothetical protein